MDVITRAVENKSTIVRCVMATRLSESQTRLSESQPLLKYLMRYSSNNGTETG